MISPDNLANYVTVVGIAAIGIYQRYIDLRASRDRKRISGKIEDLHETIKENKNGNGSSDSKCS